MSRHEKTRRKAPSGNSDLLDSRLSGEELGYLCQAASRLLRAISNPHRLRMLYRMVQEERTVSWLADDAQVQPHIASSHLRAMQRQRIARGVRRGKFVFYRVIDQRVVDIVGSITDAPHSP